MTDQMRALANAVLAGEEAAALALMDELQSRLAPEQAREWLRLWDECAMRIMADSASQSPAHFVDYARENPRRGYYECQAVRAYEYADAFMAVRAQRLKSRFRAV